MARDNSPEKRQQAQLKRKQRRRADCDRILIVTEGSKTEPNYFNEIRKKYRLSTTNVQVQHSQLGTTPLQVVGYAASLFRDGDKNRGIQPRAFERIFAVFDRDDHITYHDALAQAKTLNNTLKNDLKQPVHFKAIASIPSFELWLLLHYEDIQAPLDRFGVIKRLKGHIRHYDKSMPDAFETTARFLPIATERAEKLATNFTAYTEPNPFTDIFELVKLLMTLKS